MRKRRGLTQCDAVAENGINTKYLAWIEEGWVPHEGIWGKVRERLERAAAAFAAAEQALAAAGDGAYLPVVSELKVRKALFLISQGELREAGPLLRSGLEISREVVERQRPDDE